MVSFVNKFFEPDGVSLIAQLVKTLPAMQETPIQFLGQRDSPGEERGYPLQLGLRWWLKW